MSFKAYIDNIQTKTGQTPEDFRRLAEARGFTQNGTLLPTIKTQTLVDWLQTDFALGPGHAMAIVALLQRHKSAAGF